MAKGLAIVLVVFGHIVARADPSGVTWYEPLRRAVYAFHMPFFLYLSGMVAVLSGGIFVPASQWRYLVAARSRRLLIPFFALGFAIVCGKVLAAKIVFVDNQPDSMATGLASLVWHTADSPALSIWYLFVLFAFSIAAPPLVWLGRGRLGWVVAAGLLLYCIPFPAFLYLDHLGRYAIFFGLGAWAASQGEIWNHFVDRYWRFLLVLLLLVLVMIAGFGAHWLVELELLPVGALSMPALHGLVRHLSANYVSMLLFLGRHSFMIYLFNTIFIGLAKGILFGITDWNGKHFLPVAIVLLISGLFGPILLKDMVFQRVRMLDRYTM